jgi:hypothetical protein
MLLGFAAWRNTFAHGRGVKEIEDSDLTFINPVRQKLEDAQEDARKDRRDNPAKEGLAQTVCLHSKARVLFTAWTGYMQGLIHGVGEQFGLYQD